MSGSRVNEAYVCTKNGGTLDWKEVGCAGATRPSPRASQSAEVYNGKCYIFGGMDEDNTKFGDLWELDLAADTWKECVLPAGSPQP